MDDENADMVIGTRVYDKDPLNRRINRWLWNTLVRGMFGYLATDIDCGFKVFKSKIVKGLNLTSNGALLDTQLLANIRMTRAKNCRDSSDTLAKIGWQFNWCKPKSNNQSPAGIICILVGIET